MKEIHVLSLGAGVQSTTVYLLAMDRKLKLDYAVFADTGDEPIAVYEHLAWLESLNGPPILRSSRGRLSEALLNQSSKRCASVPFFTLLNGSTGITNRQCSKDYKVDVVRRAIRQNILGLKARQRIKNMKLYEYFGISLDEARRSIAIRKRVRNPVFPLLDLQWTRADCYEYLKNKVPHEVPRSACVYCPFHSDAEWIKIRKNPKDWALAVKVDAGLRNGVNAANRKVKALLFAHRSCVPLEMVQFKNERQFNMFTTECEGMCGL